MNIRRRLLSTLPLLLLVATFAARAEAVSPLATWVDSLTVGGQPLVYDEKGDRYFLHVPESALDEEEFLGDVCLKCDDEYAVYIGSSRLKDGEMLSLHNPGFGKTFKLTVYQNWKSIYTSMVETTTLPLIIINTQTSIRRTDYTEGTFRMLCADASQAVPDDVTAKYRIRGATSANYAKKSYNVKFFDETGEKEDRTFFGMRNDNSWILDAMAIDKACVRNRLAMDLWNSYATLPYYSDHEKKVRTGTRGKYVEVFLNGSYNGLYCFSEKIDRKQLRLKKSTDATTTTEEQIHGLLYKATQWHWTVMMGHKANDNAESGTPPAYDNNDGTGEWLSSWEIKYPDYESQRIDWEPLWNLINFCSTTDEDYFESNVDRYLDIPVLLDYWLLLEITLAWDNDGKNMYYFCYDAADKKGGTRMSIAPWDLDATWGRAWNGLNEKQKNAEMDYRANRKNSSGGIMYYNKLEDSEIYDWEGMIRDRYHELRRKGLLSEEKLLERLNTYAELFNSSGARGREEKRWTSSGYHEDIAADVVYMTDWISRRIAALDSQYGYDPATSGTADVEASSRLRIEGGQGRIAVHAASPTDISIYNTGGQLVRRMRITSGVKTIDGLTPGIYVVNGLKVLVR